MSEARGIDCLACGGQGCRLCNWQNCPELLAPSVGWTRRAVLLDVVLWVLLWAFAALTPAKAAELPTVGMVCTYTDLNGTDWAATVQAIASGPGGLPWAWLTINADPRRIVKLPAFELQGRCS